MIFFRHFRAIKDVYSMAASSVAAILFLSAAKVMCWEIETVDDGSRRFSDMTEQSLVFDNTGNPHLAYGGDRLYYTWFDGFRWNYEIADNTPSVGSRASLALDAADKPHICYVDSINSSLKYAQKTENGWQITAIDTVGSDLSLYPHPSVEVGFDGVPYITYHDEASNALKYAYLSENDWIIETIDNDAYGGGSLELDGADMPHVAYTGNLCLRYAFRTESGWQIETITVDYCLDFWMSLELDTSGYPHATRARAGGSGDQGLFYGYKDETGWYTELIADYVQSSSSLELDDDAYPHIAYEYGGIQYA